MEKLNQMIDHTLLKPTASREDILHLCEEAKKYKFKTVCVHPCHIKTCVTALEGTQVGVCTVIGFPLGANLPNVKSFETRLAIDAGAQEVDMVINIGALKEGRDKLVTDEIASVVEAAAGRVVKVILETGLLKDEEIIRACRCATEAKAHFVKTSTGFAGSGATVAAVSLMKANISPEMQVKASGGIRDLASAEKMINAGAGRLGASASVAIVTGGSTQEAY
ncbi:MAG: deoxyribose-phosphate aldolase [Halobacteriovoraceae bacterium]|nr:deoxyribose-phosphate aldolase [Halobacteriovoraceae bacterium]MBC99406.1 deoxyribose-phosphate aldolase [Halobacteriovoraceae bacterium]|tara:strand:- start:75178 stop:75843 length:666 start_codon:yes stop_codon:yes gene_type:complete